MKKITILLAITVFSMGSYAQDKKLKGPHGGEVISLDDIQIEMTKVTHLEKEKRLEFYLFDPYFNELGVSNIEGRVIVAFNDETQRSKKIRIDGNVLWIALSNHTYSNFQQVIIKIKLNNKKFKASFGEPIIHMGHHH